MRTFMILIEKSRDHFSKLRAIRICRAIYTHRRLNGTAQPPEEAVASWKAYPHLKKGSKIYTCILGIFRPTGIIVAYPSWKKVSECGENSVNVARIIRHFHAWLPDEWRHTSTSDDAILVLPGRLKIWNFTSFVQIAEHEFLNLARTNLWQC